MRVLIITPKNSLSGGNIECSRLIGYFTNAGCVAEITQLFKSSTSVFDSIFSILPAYIAVVRFAAYRKFDVVILTHYSTIALAPIVKLLGKRSIVFLQDFEWLFPSSNVYIQHIFLIYHFFCYLFIDYFLFGNSYLYSSFPFKKTFFSLLNSRAHSLVYPVGELPASEDNIAVSSVIEKPACSERHYDICFIMRKGWLKSSSFYVEVLDELNNICSHMSIRALCIDMGTGHSFKGLSNIEIDLMPPLPQQHFFDHLLNCRIFLCLSSHEGFGLPALEAMAAGAIPVLLNNGGCKCYTGDLPQLVLPRSSTPLTVAYKIVHILSLSSDRLYELSANMQVSARSYYAEAAVARRFSIEKLISIYGTQ